MHKNEYINALRDLGCTEIGKGLYSNVFNIPNTDKCIKVADMDRWPEYIQWATRQGYAGKYAPKVYSLKFKSDGDREYYVAVMERLVCTIGQIEYSEGRRNHCDQVDLFHAATALDPSEYGEADEFKAFIGTMKSEGYRGDLHDGNAMVRHDGQIVVTDPCAGCFSGTPYRIKSGICL